MEICGDTLKCTLSLRIQQFPTKSTIHYKNIVKPTIQSLNSSNHKVTFLWTYFIITSQYPCISMGINDKQYRNIMVNRQTVGNIGLPYDQPRFISFISFYEMLELSTCISSLLNNERLISQFLPVGAIRSSPFLVNEQSFQMQINVQFKTN